MDTHFRVLYHIQFLNTVQFLKKKGKGQIDKLNVAYIVQFCLFKQKSKSKQVDNG